MPPDPRSRRLFVAALVLLTAVVWLEPKDSNLAEADETRYAEVPREMLAARDLVVPRLNGVPYLEKPPLLYWANAASLKLFGETPWAARLPTRLAGLGTTLVLVFGVGAIWGELAGLAAALVYLITPAGFLFSRANLTDGLLTLLFALTLFGAREALLRRSRGQPALVFAALAGLAAGGAFLTKGLIAVVLPGAILFLWCAWTGRLRALVTLGLFPALPVFLAVSLPWLLAAEARVPGFLEFFFVHEHFQRFATGEAQRPGPVYYFVGVFAAGFLPSLAFLPEGLRGLGRPARWKDEQADALFFVLWFAVVFVFFSISRSKLPPYLQPALPAAAALAGRGLLVARDRGPWLTNALLALLLPAVAAALPVTRRLIPAYGLTGLVLFASAVLVAGSFLAVALSRRGPAPAALALAVAWAGLFTAVAFGWPKLPTATGEARISRAARAEASASGARIVAYRTYLNAFSWELKTPIPVTGYRGELEPEFEDDAALREDLFWTRGQFWNAWARGQPLVVLVRKRDRDYFDRSSPPARVIAEETKHMVVTNVP